MQSFPEIPVIVNPESDNTAQIITDNVRALLAEISSLLTDLIHNDKTGSIDLRSLPLLPGEYDAIKTILGEGEVHVHFDSTGPTQIYETGLGGVWWVRHENENNECIAELIEVTPIPEILKSPRNEIEISQSALQQQLQEWSEETE